LSYKKLFYLSLTNFSRGLSNAKPHGAQHKPQVVQRKDTTGNTHSTKAKHNTALIELPEEVSTALIKKAGMGV